MATTRTFKAGDPVPADLFQMENIRSAIFGVDLSVIDDGVEFTLVPHILPMTDGSVCIRIETIDPHADVVFYLLQPRPQ